MTTTQPRERAVACQWCWPRTRRTTWNTSAVCDDCTHLATLVPNPTQITETVWGPRLDVDAGIAPEPLGLPDSCTEADTAAAWARWCRDHTGMTA